MSSAVSCRGRNCAFLSKHLSARDFRIVLQKHPKRNNNGPNELLEDFIMDSISLIHLDNLRVVRHSINLCFVGSRNSPNCVGRRCTAKEFSHIRLSGSRSARLKNLTHSDIITLQNSFQSSEVTIPNQSIIASSSNDFRNSRGCNYRRGCFCKAQYIIFLHCSHLFPTSTESIDFQSRDFAWPSVCDVRTSNVQSTRKDPKGLLRVALSLFSPTVSASWRLSESTLQFASKDLI